MSVNTLNRYRTKSYLYGPYGEESHKNEISC